MVVPLRSVGRTLALAALAVVVASAGCSSDPDLGVLQAADLEKPEGLEAKFDRNAVIDSASLKDVDGIDSAVIQRLFRRTPYDRPSFLETYQSNGVRASDAIARAARTYRINPLFFLVKAQTAGGLLGADSYPFPPERVEYVFRCGCQYSGACNPQLAGFDKQVDCLGRQMRSALDAIAREGLTASSWGPDKTSTTLDGQKVTPADDATAALYDLLPYVAEGKAGGNWLFWNIWQLYALKSDYAGPIGAPVGGAWIGEACDADGTCGFEGGTCATNYPAGLCTASCTGDCPQEPDKPLTFCADFKTQGGFCFAICNPGAPACRTGYKCQLLGRFKGKAEDARHVCYPEAATQR